MRNSERNRRIYSEINKNNGLEKKQLLELFFLLLLASGIIGFYSLLLDIVMHGDWEGSRQNDCSLFNVPQMKPS